MQFSIYTQLKIIPTIIRIYVQKNISCVVYLNLIEDDIRWCLYAFIIILWIYMTECIYMCMWLYTWCMCPLTVCIQSTYWLLWLGGTDHASYMHAQLY